MKLPRALLAASLLLLPRAGAIAAGAPDPPPEAVVGAFPFEPSHEPNRIYVNLAEEGSAPFVMLLDTGANASVVTPLMARHLNVTVRRDKSSPYRRGTRLGRDLQFWVDTRSSDTGSKTGWEYGLLGGEFMDDYVVDIDFAARKVLFLDPKKYMVPEQVDAPDERVLGLRLASSRISVPVSLGGQQVDVMLDTGAPPPLILSGKAARKVGIDVEALPRFGRGGTTVGPMEQRFYEAERFAFGDFPIEPLPVIVAPKGWYNIAGNTDSVIGYDVLRHFHVRIDYPRRRMWLKRIPGKKVTLYGADYAVAKAIGAFLIPFAGYYEAWRVAPDGPAAKYGLRDGDRIERGKGEAKLGSEDVAQRIEQRGSLSVRRLEGDAVVEVELPEVTPPAQRGE
jgi:hypothetical protein